MHGFRKGKSGTLKRARLANQIEGFQTTEKLEKKISQFINLMHMTWADPDSLSMLTDLYSTKNKFKPKKKTNITKSYLQKGSTCSQKLHNVCVSCSSKRVCI